MNLDVFRTVSLPQFSFTAMLSYSKKKIPYITDPTMYDIAEAGLKGGLNIVAKRITEIEDHSKEKILYTDMKSMYVHTMQQPLPSGGYKWVVDATCDRLLEITQTIDLNQEGALVTIDVVFPAHVHDSLADFPPVFEKKVHTPDQYPMRYTYYNVAQRVPKLTDHLASVHSYTCTMQELLLIVNLGGLVTKTKSILMYKVEPYARGYLVTPT